MRKIIIYLLILSLWLINMIIFPINVGYFLSLNTPIFTINYHIIPIIQIIVYILNSTSLYYLIKEYDLDNDFNFIIIMSYLSHELYPLLFFYLNSLLLPPIISIISTTSTYFLIIETKKINKTLSVLFIPYFLLNIYTTILSISIYLLN